MCRTTAFLMGFVLSSFLCSIFFCCLFVPFLSEIVLSVLLRITASNHNFWYLQTSCKTYRSSRGMLTYKNVYVRLHIHVYRHRSFLKFHTYLQCIVFQKNLVFPMLKKTTIISCILLGYYIVVIQFDNNYRTHRL